MTPRTLELTLEGADIFLWGVDEALKLAMVRAIIEESRRLTNEDDGSTVDHYEGD